MELKEYLTLEDIAKMASYAKCVRDALLIWMLFWLSCRISELLGIRVEDVDAVKGTVTIKHLKTRISLICPGCGTRLSRSARFCPGCGSPVPEPLKKEQESHRFRTIPLEKQTMDMLIDFITRDGTEGLIFKIGREQALKIVKDCSYRAGIRELWDSEKGRFRGVSPHRLRDAFATMAVQLDDGNDSMRMLQEHLGHANIGTTMKYRKIAGREHREWYSKITESEVANNQN